MCALDGDMPHEKKKWWPVDTPKRLIGVGQGAERKKLTQREKIPEKNMTVHFCHECNNMLYPKVLIFNVIRISIFNFRF